MPFKVAQDALALVTWAWDARRNRTTWSGDIAPLLGLLPAAFSGRFEDYLGRVHPDDREATRAVYRDCVKGLRPTFRSEARVIWPDGTVRWLETYCRARYGRTGRAVELYGVVVDCTGRKLREAALAESEERFQKAFDSSQEAIAITRVSDDRVVSINRSMEALYGAPAADAIGRTTNELDFWADEGRSYAAIVASLRAERRVRNLEVAVRSRAGERRTCIYSADVIEIRGEFHVIAFLRDVTEQRQAERQARQSLDRFTAVFANSPDSIAISRLRDGQVLAVNDAWVRLNGYPREDVLKLTAPRVGQWLPGDREAVMAELRRTGRVVNRLTTFLRRDGSLRQSLISVVLVDLDGEPCTVWMGRDVSDLQRAQQELETQRLQAEAEIRQLNVTLERRVEERTAALEAANRELESYSYTVSHDLRAPIRAILGFSEILRTRHADGLSAESLRLFERIEGNAQRMGELIDDLLEFSRTGRVSLSSVRIDMRALVEAVWRELGAQGAPLPAFRPGELHDAYGDPSLVRQVWLNLLGNAVK